MTANGLDPSVLREVADFTPTAPDKSQRIGELAALRETVRLPLLAPRLLMTRKGSGQRAVVLPGYSTNDAFLTPLRTFLKTRNHEAVGWGLGTNGGDVAGYVAQVRENLLSSGAEHEPVNLIGWSLGGVIAREVARDRPDIVSRVVTFGTPLLGPRYTTAREAYSAEQIADIEKQIDERAPDLIDVPVTAVFSRNDNIVDWRTCVDLATPGIEHVEVTSTHIGMTIDPEVWEVIANRLGTDARSPNPLS